MVAIKSNSTNYPSNGHPAKVFFPFLDKKPNWKWPLFQSSFWIKLTNWEFWDFGVVYASVGILHLYQSLKAGSFFYFSASNPGLENSGFIGERKSEIINILPRYLQPKVVLISK